jgi:hypothetical protein
MGPVFSQDIAAITMVCVVIGCVMFVDSSVKSISSICASSRQSEMHYESRQHASLNVEITCATARNIRITACPYGTIGQSYLFFGM